MTFRQGKFYDDTGICVPLEHGNAQQLELIALVSRLRDGVYYFLMPGGGFKCPCGITVNKDWEDGKQFKCSCGAIYLFKYDEDDVPTLFRRN